MRAEASGGKRMIVADRAATSEAGQNRNGEAFG
jgi:hypothetical protein